MFIFLRYTWSILFVRWIEFLWNVVWMLLLEHHETLSFTSSFPFLHFWLKKKTQRTWYFIHKGLILGLNGLILPRILFFFYSTLAHFRFWRHEINRMAVLQCPRRIWGIVVDWIIVFSSSLLPCYRLSMTFQYLSPSKQSVFLTPNDTGVGYMNYFSQWIVADVIQGKALALLLVFGLEFCIFAIYHESNIPHPRRTRRNTEQIWTQCVGWSQAQVTNRPLTEKNKYLLV